MIAIKTILLPTDGSDCSWKAVAYALAIAKQCTARVVAFHVVDQAEADQMRRGLVEGAASGELFVKVRKDYEDLVRSLLQEVVGAAQRAGVPIETSWVIGVPAADIVQLATEVRADLIVLGTHGRRGMSHLLLGSVAEQVVRTAPCPVLTVRRDAHDFVDAIEAADPAQAAPGAERR
jgi:nucleotide-binding universal stress UspA family protein